MAIKPKTPTQYLLLALVPYSRPNIDLAINLPRFFNELEKVSKSNKKNLRSAYYRAKRSGLVEMKGKSPVLTSKGRVKIQPYVAKKLKKDVQLMVILILRRVKEKSVISLETF